MKIKLTTMSMTELGDSRGATVKGLREAEDRAVQVVRHSQVVAYLVSPALWHTLIEEAKRAWAGSENALAMDTEPPALALQRRKKKDAPDAIRAAKEIRP